jgi:hypothetical protein
LDSISLLLFPKNILNHDFYFWKWVLIVLYLLAVPCRQLCTICWVIAFVSLDFFYILSAYTESE